MSHTRRILHMQENSPEYRRFMDERIRRMTRVLREHKPDQGVVEAKVPAFTGTTIRSQIVFTPRNEEDAA